MNAILTTSSLAGAPRCRVCSSVLTHQVLKLSRMPLTDDFARITQPSRQEYVKDIDIYECSNCGIVQNPADFNHEAYYQDYQYSSGHSGFTQRFMAAYADVTCQAFLAHHHRPVSSVLEIGSGDGQQLKQFFPLGVSRVKGIEPSDYLATIANDRGIDTDIALFDAAILHTLSSEYDICLSSYTFDHVRNPVEYLETAHKLLVDGGVLAFEIHNLGTIIQRSEYCLFEHEHTIYLTNEDACYLLENTGFRVVSINPLPSGVTRGNSLIVIAIKESKVHAQFQTGRIGRNLQLDHLNTSIEKTIGRLDAWIKELPGNSSLVGFGAGGRGVMTLAALKEYKRFDALFDSNYQSGLYLTPKTRIPIVGPDQWHAFEQAYCLVFSFGYFDEIVEQLLKAGFHRNRIVSLLDFCPTSSLASDPV